MDSHFDVLFHQLVQKDLNDALRYLEENTNRKTADEFFELFLEEVERAQNNPQRNHLTPNGYRGCNLKRFKYHFLYRVKDHCIRIQVLKHDSRHPNLGLRRQL